MVDTTAALLPGREARDVEPRPRRRGRPPRLSRGQVVEAALALAREGGLPAVSIRAVAERLGAAEMTLYTYVASKDELVRAMLDTAFAADLTLPDPADGRPPAEQLRGIFRQLHAIGRDHVELLALVGRTSATQAAPLAAMECVVRLLAQLGLQPRDLVRVHALLYQATVTSALISGNQARAQAHGVPVTPFGGDLPAAEHYPHLAQLLTSIDLTGSDGDFEDSLQVILDIVVPHLLAATSGAAR